MRTIERRMTNGAAAQVTSRRTGGGSGHICTGYGAVYYCSGDPSTEYVLWDTPGNRAVERLMPGCFDDVLSTRPDTRLLFNHDPNCILGRTSNGTLELSSDKTGLRYLGQLNDTTIGLDVAKHLDRGDITGSSFSFAIAPDGEHWRDERQPDGTLLTIREIARVQELADVSPVTFPAYVGTSAGMRVDGADPATMKMPPRAPDPAVAAKIEAMRKRAAEMMAEVERDRKCRAVTLRARQVMAEVALQPIKARARQMMIECGLL